MPRSLFNKFKSWLKDVFPARTDIFVAIILLLFVLVNVLKITIFNQVLVPQADKFMFRFKFLTTLLIVAAIYPILFRFRSRALFITFYVLQTLYILVNMSYYLYFNNYLHIEVFIQNFYEGFVAVMNASSPKNPLLLVSFLDLPFFVFLTVTYFKANRLRKKLWLIADAVVVLALLATAYTQYGHYKNKVFITNIAQNHFLGESRIVQRYGTLVNSAVSIYYGQSTEDYIKSFKYGKQIVKTAQKAEKPNIFIVQVESMDAVIVNQQHNGKYVMPYMNSLENNSVYFPYMVSYHFGGGTSDTEFSIINSVEPLVGYPAIKLTTYKAPNAFIKQLNAAGYESLAFHGNIGRYYNRDLSFRTYGFEEYYSIEKMNMKDVGWGAPDEKVFDFALNRISGAEKPVLSYAITMTSHGPFTSVLNYADRSDYDDVQDKLVRDYFVSMSYVDRSIQNYIEAIQKKYDNAYIIIFGDHTPKIKSPDYRQADTMIDGKNYEFVPLYIITPDKAKYREENRVASTLDLAPTILNAAGISYDYRSDGTDLLDHTAEPGKIPYRGLVWDRTALFKDISKALGK
ncbi:MAG TPA: LTA synthase family protein [Clostridia bacterium]|nr:LTA synthase family protein [Clostridia bacterium]